MKDELCILSLFILGQALHSFRVSIYQASIHFHACFIIFTCNMNGYHPGAGSPLTFVDTNDTTMDYTMDQSAHFFEEQQIAQTCSAGFEQSSGASPATNDFHEQARLTT
jgi:hypothetical protein